MDKKIAFIFPGQGAQYIGMGKQLYERYKECENVFNYANEVLGRNIKEICFHGNMSDLTQTINTQPAIFVLESAILSIMDKYNIKPEVVAGFSVGEYAALYASGRFDLTTSLYLVNLRASLMNEASQEGFYGMGAITGGKIKKIEELCTKYENVWVANYNTQHQVSITGEKKDVLKVIDEAKELGYFTIEINVSGAFHSPLMKEFSGRFYQGIHSIESKRSNIPIVLNQTGNYMKADDDIKEVMKRQMYSPVKWQQSIQLMLEDGINTFIEIGPGRVLSSFVKKISDSKEISIMNIEDMQTLNKVIDFIYD